MMSIEGNGTTVIRMAWHDEPGNDMHDYNNDDFEFHVMPGAGEGDEGPVIFIELPNPERDEDVFGPVLQINLDDLIDALVRLGWDRELLLRAEPDDVREWLVAGPRFEA